MTRTRRLLVLLAVLAVATPAAAHVPSFPADNTSPDRAVAVPDAAKSWSFYDRLGRGEAVYYRVTLDAGERLRVGTFTPSAGAFTPAIVLLGTSVDGGDRVPPQVTVPEGMGAVVVAGERPAAPSYEPFAPSANYHTADVDRRVDAGGTYLVAVYDVENRSGPVGVALGYREEFSPVEYLTVPFDLVRTHLWEGQHPLLAVGPWLVTLAGGLALVRARRPPGRPLSRYALGAGALAVAATGVNTLVQMGLALSRTGPTPGALVTAAFVVVPLACGAWALRVALGDAPLTPRRRAGLALAGAVALATWAGFLVGPALLLAVAALPRRVVEA